MIGRLAVRSLTAHPVRSGVLAAGFGFGVAVMAILLGVAEVVLDQAQAPGLVGGGDVVIRVSDQVPARLLLSGTLQGGALRPRIAVVAPSHSTPLFLLRPKGGTVRVDAQGGIPSLERALGDRETSDEGLGDARAVWRDTPADVAWTADTPERVLRHIDRFHPVPEDTEWSTSWAEWLYFNGRAGDVRFYLTFLVGPRLGNGKRAAAVRLQLEHDGTLETYGAAAELTDDEVLRAPDLTVGASSVRLDGLVYRIHLELEGGPAQPMGADAPASARARVARRRLVGDIALEASPGRLVPPVQVSGARGWRTGYVVPVMSGHLDGGLTLRDDSSATRARGTPPPGETRLSLAGGAGYHDHNWGFWQGVSWQWGQVQNGELSFIYGRVFPPREAADPERMPGFVGALGPDGPLGYATDVKITEVDDEKGRPKTVTIRARGTSLDLDIRFDAVSAVTTRMSQGPLANGVNFLQMRGQYSVSGRAADRRIQFTAPGAAETFRGE